MLLVSEIFDLKTEVEGMLPSTRIYSKKVWSSMVWAKAWVLENRDWTIRTNIFKVTQCLNTTRDTIKPLIWWELGDVTYVCICIDCNLLTHDIMHCCEMMVKLVCRASKLKADIYRFRNNCVNRPYCDLC